MEAPEENVEAIEEEGCSYKESQTLPEDATLSALENAVTTLPAACKRFYCQSPPELGEPAIPPVNTESHKVVVTEPLQVSPRTESAGRIDTANDHLPIQESHNQNSSC